MSKYPDTIDKITKARLAFSAFSSILSIALTMFFIGILALIVFFSNSFINEIRRNFEMEVLFYSEDAGVKEADIVAYEQQLKLQDFVQTSRVSSQKDNTEMAKAAVGNNYEEVIANPINASIILTLKPEYYNNADSLNKVIKQIKQNEMVQDVEYASDIVQSLQTNFRTIQWVVFGFCAVFVCISLLLIGNCLRLNIYAKRFNIKSLLLIGATRGFVRRPFVFKGLVQGTWGGFIAVVLLGLLVYLGYAYTPEILNVLDVNTITIVLCGTFVFSILYTMFISFIYVNKYIKINSDQLYL